MNAKATGARPGEIFNAESHHYRKEIGAIVYRWNATEGYVWKSARKTKKDRFIFLPAGLQAEIEALVAKHPTGRIFRTPRGRVWGNANVSETIRSLRKKKQVVEGLRANNHPADRVILFGFRHSYITGWLKTGRSIKIVFAQLPVESVPEAPSSPRGEGASGTDTWHVSRFARARKAFVRESGSSRRPVKPLCASRGGVLPASRPSGSVRRLSNAENAMSRDLTDLLFAERPAATWRRRPSGGRLAKE